MVIIYLPAINGNIDLKKKSIDATMCNKVLVRAHVMEVIIRAE